MSEPAARFTLQVDQVRGFEFVTHFDKDHFEPLKTDEPPPLGQDTAPNPARVLAAAIGNCLAASLVFCMKKANIPVEHAKAEVTVELVRNENKRLRVGRVDVKLNPNLGADHPALQGCLDVFEDFCVVTQSVREGIQVDVQVQT